MKEDLFTKILFREDEILSRCKELAHQINMDYKDKTPIFVCTLKGGFMFFSDLIKHIEGDINIEFIKASSYFGNQSSGNVKLQETTQFEVKGKDILIIEDIVDTGYTIEKLIYYFKQKGANSIEIVTLLDKACKRVVDVKPKYSGFVIDDYFVIGYGLDYNEKYRNYPYIGIMNVKYIEQ